jgi:hypothetical protein
MNVRTLLRASTLAALATLIVGCAGPLHEPITPRSDPYQRQQIHMVSEDLKYRTAVDTPHVWRDDGGLLHITLPIRSTVDQQLYIDYRVTFLDRDGLPISQTGWMRKTLPPNVPDQFSVNSTSPLAADFQIDIRYAQ